MTDLYESHHADRDKFEIIAFHEPSAKDFAQLDKELEKVKAAHWHGKDLPFPILLDASGETIKTYGPTGYPTTILIDPNGILVGEVRGDALAEKLPPVPMAERLLRGLDRGVYLYIDQVPLRMVIEQILPQQCSVPIRIDAAAGDAAKDALAAPLKLAMNTQISLRSALDLLLTPAGLAFEAHDDGLVIVVKARRVSEPPSGAELSEAQKFAAARIEKNLTDTKVSLEFKDKPLSEVLDFFAEKTGESLLLDPSAQRQGKADPKAVLTVSCGELPARSALGLALKPLRLTFVVRDELILIVPDTAPSPAASKP